MENTRVCTVCNIERNLGQYISKAGRTNLKNCLRCRNMKTRNSHRICEHSHQMALREELLPLLVRDSDAYNSLDNESFRTNFNKTLYETDFPSMLAMMKDLKDNHQKGGNLKRRRCFDQIPGLDPRFLRHYDVSPPSESRSNRCHGCYQGCSSCCLDSTVRHDPRFFHLFESRLFRSLWYYIQVFGDEGRTYCWSWVVSWWCGFIRI